MARVLALLLAFGFTPALAADADVDRETIERFHAALIDSMKSGRDAAARADSLSPAIRAGFDVETIAKVSLGRAWRALPSEQRVAFVALLTDLIVSTYADRFDSFRGQRFETLAVTSPRPGRSIVKARLVRATGDPVPLDYYIAAGRIYDIVADGVSDLSLRRADYAAIIAQRGFEGLLAEIERTIAVNRRTDAPSAVIDAP